jgi:hypothetical protein
MVSDLVDEFSSPSAQKTASHVADKEWVGEAWCWSVLV